MKGIIIGLAMFLSVCLTLDAQAIGRSCSRGGGCSSESCESGSCNREKSEQGVSAKNDSQTLQIDDLLTQIKSLKKQIAQLQMASNNDLNIADNIQFSKDIVRVGRSNSDRIIPIIQNSNPIPRQSKKKN